MSNKKLIKSNSMVRLKKFPPPLNLPPIPNEQIPFEQKPSTNNYSCSTSSCSHQSIPYVLPIFQRPQILEQLKNSSSSLLIAPSRRSQNLINSNQLKQRQEVTVTDQQWIDCIRLIISKSLTDEIKVLLDKYKMTYFDRINVSDTSDGMIRTSLCEIVSQTLATYSSSSSTVTNNNEPHISSSLLSTNGISKRQRDNFCDLCSLCLNNETKFVISYIVPGKCANSNQFSHQQRVKQFQKKFSHLFTYILNEEVQSYLIDQGYLQINSRITNCLMLYDEIVTYMDEYDLELSGISPDHSFTLPDSILKYIHFCAS
ncbi:hypothetical protein I4U23_000272 [Adineta vaga]|nr:hypothetical protein I4U23_000272 [Adineta vaga]